MSNTRTLVVKTAPSSRSSSISISSTVESSRTNPRKSSHNCAQAVIKELQEKCGVNEPQAVSMLSAFSNSRACRQYLEGGYENSGREEGYDADALAYSAIKANVELNYPSLTSPDVAAQIVLCVEYFFEITLDHTDLDKALVAAFDKKFLENLDALEERLGADFIKESEIDANFAHIRRQKSLVEKPGAAGRMFQVELVADLVATLVHNCKKRPEILKKISTPFLESVITEMESETSLAPIAYNVPSPITIKKMINIGQSTKYTKRVFFDPTTAHLISSDADMPSDETIGCLEIFGVLSDVRRTEYPGFHKIGRRIVVTKDDKGNTGEAIVIIYSKDSGNYLENNRFYLGAVAGGIHSLLGIPISKPSFTFRQGKAFKRDVQKTLIRSSFFTEGSIKLIEKKDNKKNKKPKTQVASNASTPTSQQQEEKPEKSGFNFEHVNSTPTRKILEAKNTLPGLGVIEQFKGSPDYESKKEELILKGLPDYIDYLENEKPSQMAWTFYQTAKEHTNELFSAILAYAEFEPGAKIHEMIEPVVCQSLNGEITKQFRDSIGLIMEKQQRELTEDNFKMWGVRIMIALVVCCVHVNKLNVHFTKHQATVAKGSRDYHNNKGPRGRSSSKGRRGRSHSRHNGAKNNNKHGGKWPYTRG